MLRELHLSGEGLELVKDQVAFLDVLEHLLFLFEGDSVHLVAKVLDCLGRAPLEKVYDFVL